MRWSVEVSAETPCYFAVDFRRGAAVEGGEAQHRELADLQLVDVLRIDLGLDLQFVGVRHDQHDRIAGGDDAADGVNRRLERRRRSAARGYRCGAT